MSDSKKYYFLKLKENFFDSEEMKILESQQNGVEYQNFYLKLCLLSLKSDGVLTFKEYIPYDAKMLSTVLRVDIDTVAVGIDLFKRLGLLDVLDTGEMYMTDIQSLIGKSSSEAERIKAYRTKMMNRTNVITNVQNCTPEIEKEIEKEIDIKKDTQKKPKESPFKPPSKEELKAFCISDNFEIDYDDFIGYYTRQGWKLSNGNKMKDWKAAARLWYRRELKWALEKKNGSGVREDEPVINWGTK